MKTPLIPCPFCGCDNIELKKTGKNKMKIRCLKCHIGLEQKTLMLGMDWLENTLIESWNKRSLPEPPQA